MYAKFSISLFVLLFMSLNSCKIKAKRTEFQTQKASQLQASAPQVAQIDPVKELDEEELLKHIMEKGIFLVLDENDKEGEGLGLVNYKYSQSAKKTKGKIHGVEVKYAQIKIEEDDPTVKPKKEATKPEEDSPDPTIQSKIDSQEIKLGSNLQVVQITPSNLNHLLQNGHIEEETYFLMNPGKIPDYRESYQIDTMDIRKADLKKGSTGFFREIVLSGDRVLVRISPRMFSFEVPGPIGRSLTKKFNPSPEEILKSLDDFPDKPSFLVNLDPKIAKLLEADEAFKAKFTIVSRGEGKFTITRKLDDRQVSKLLSELQEAKAEYAKYEEGMKKYTTQQFKEWAAEALEYLGYKVKDLEESLKILGIRPETAAVPIKPAVKKYVTENQIEFSPVGATRPEGAVLIPAHLASRMGLGNQDMYAVMKQPDSEMKAKLERVAATLKEWESGRSASQRALAARFLKPSSMNKADDFEKFISFNQLEKLVDSRRLQSYLQDFLASQASDRTLQIPLHRYWALDSILEAQKLEGQKIITELHAVLDVETIQWGLKTNLDPEIIKQLSELGNDQQARYSIRRELANLAAKSKLDLDSLQTFLKCLNGIPNESELAKARAVAIQFRVGGLEVLAPETIALLQSKNLWGDSYGVKQEQGKAGR